MRIDHQTIIQELKAITAAAEKTRDLDILLVLGPTGAGKSTLINALLGHKIIQIDADDYGRPLYAVETDRETSSATIGHDNHSLTRSPEVFELPNSSLHLCDTPGLRDTGGTELRTTTGIGIKLAAQAAESIKIIILIDLSVCLGERGGALKDFFRDLNNLFTNVAGFNSDSFAFCLTKPLANARLERLPELVKEPLAECEWLRKLYVTEGEKKNVFIIKYSDNVDAPPLSFVNEITQYFSKSSTQIPKEKVKAFIDQNTRLLLQAWFNETLKKAASILDLHHQSFSAFDENHKNLLSAQTRLHNLQTQRLREEYQTQRLHIELSELAEILEHIKPIVPLLRDQSQILQHNSGRILAKLEELRSVTQKIISEWRAPEVTLSPGTIYAKDISLLHAQGDKLNKDLKTGRLIHEREMTCADGSHVFLATYECSNTSGNTPKRVVASVQITRDMTTSPEHATQIAATKTALQKSSEAERKLLALIASKELHIGGMEHATASAGEEYHKKSQSYQQNEAGHEETLRGLEASILQHRTQEAALEAALAAQQQKSSEITPDIEAVLQIAPHIELEEPNSIEQLGHILGGMRSSQAKWCCLFPPAASGSAVTQGEVAPSVGH